MTTAATSAQEAAEDACKSWCLDAKDLAPVRVHATSVFVAPRAAAVVRVSRLAQRAALERAVALTRWLTDQGLSVTEPFAVVQPVESHGHCVTLWRYYPQPPEAPPGPEHLGALLRDLHQLPAPPVELPEYRPHAALRATIERSSVLSSADRDWLLTRSDALLSAYDTLDSPLGHGLIHGDAYPGNTMWNGTKAVLGDWDEAAVGPREIDLANTFQGTRFGRTDDLLRAFSDSYGHDLTDWPGLRVLIELRDMHTLGSFIQRADRGDADASAQLAFRLGTLKSGDHSASWAAS